MMMLNNIPCPARTALFGKKRLGGVRVDVQQVSDFLKVNVRLVNVNGDLEAPLLIAVLNNVIWSIWIAGSENTRLFLVKLLVKKIGVRNTFKGYRHGVNDNYDPYFICEL